MAIGFTGNALRALLVGAFAMFALAMPAMAQTVRVTVNGLPITDQQIAQRVRLFSLEGNRGGQNGATEQLITEAIQLTEAQRLGITVSEAQVDQALQQVARNLNLSQDRLVATLQQAGIGLDTLRDRLEAAVAWNAVTQQAIVPNVQISDLELDQQAAGQVQTWQNFDYILKEIIFVGAGSSSRSGQANTYRSNFQGCDSAVQLSLNYTDAAVVDIGRRHATQLPEAMAQELAGLNVGGITRPRVVENGVSMLAVCEKTQAEDLTFIKDNLESQAGNAALQVQQEAYLARLREQARIVYN
jgi:peptidyl-prolyl cis-trans isomerase SurA